MPARGIISLEDFSGSANTMARIGFVINPIAGMGGRVGLKGTDGMVSEAARRGARPIANERAMEALRELKRLLEGEPGAPLIEWRTVSGAMGEDALRSAGFAKVAVVHRAAAHPSAQDTCTAVETFLGEGVDLVLFCGGDGTARDICTVTGPRTPILGIPAGVKMYSGVFGITPTGTARTVVRYLLREIGLAQVDILDLDEERYRQDEWAVRLYMSATTPFEPSTVQAAKALIAGADEQAVKDDIAAHLQEEIGGRPDCVFLLGPGSTLQAVARALHVHKTLLGIDAIADGRVIGTDLAEQPILKLLTRYRERKLVLSPIGAQGFVLGRGNQPLSPDVIRAIGVDNMILVATPAKLARTPFLRFDTGDKTLDADLIARKFLTVIIGYHRLRLVRIAG
ncbi:MAG: ATP-NAD kinase family protein [Hyphomicrobiales bacterium]|nr:ATP-NAD kinase family protein [Hyphomicrobiales bacterium]